MEDNFVSVPETKIDVVLDTDAYNEIDDQFAISYLLKSSDKLCTKAIYAAPFFNSKSNGPKDGMEKSYNEILKLMGLVNVKNIPVFKGCENYLDNEKTFVENPASRDLVRRASEYSQQQPLYVVAIGAITNVASAILMCPEIAKNMVVVWLGGHAHHYCDTFEFNMKQDFAAARVVMESDVRFVQLPCMGVVSEFRISKQELEYFFKGKNAICDYLCQNVIQEVDAVLYGKPWTRVIWDVTAIGWLLNQNERFMKTRKEYMRIPLDNGQYSKKTHKHFEYVYSINRDALMEHMINTLVK